MMLILLIVILKLNYGYAGQIIGDSCVLDANTNGICNKIINCLHATNLIKNRKHPVPCGFEGAEPIVCCPKTDEYSVSAYGMLSREYCFKHGRPLKLLQISGGKPAAPKEYPHMALLGIIQETSVDWICGGSLISSNFVLTAAHCFYHRSLGLVNSVRLGDLDISTDNDIADPSNHKIIAHYSHPEYDGNLHYHDIALVKLSGSVRRSPFIRPACLFTASSMPEIELTATGWGLTTFGGDRSSQLLTVQLHIYDHAECNSHFPPHLFRKVPRGIDANIQICAGGRNEIKDTCEGDSGGPLQVNHPDYADDNVFALIGVTSFGRACGVMHHPGVYVRILPYIQWIESIVWKDQ